MDYLKRVDPKIYRVIRDETKRQTDDIELIASENFTSLAVMQAQGSVLTNKYAEGYPNRRWYGGCSNIDEAEDLAIQRAKKLFSTTGHINVQPHSGSQANMAVYFSVLNPGDRVMAMDLACGGHLTHGHPHNFSGRLYKIISYDVNRNTEMLDYAELMTQAKKYKPKMILAGACAYPRIIDFKKFRQIADSVGAYLFVDMAHIAGLVAAGVHPSPIPYADFVSTTTHKTLRGPRGGMIICKKKYAKEIDAQIFPGIQGGPLMHVIAAKAVAFKEDLKPAFKEYQKQVVKNAKSLADTFSKRGYRVVSGGTDTHLLLIDLTNQGISGCDAAEALDKAGITVNKNLIPFDTLSASVTSGIRLGTPAVTTRGMKTRQMQGIVYLIDRVITNPKDNKVLQAVSKDVKKLTKKFPLYSELL